MLLIDSSKLRILQQEAPMGDIPIDTAQVETQVEILKSENIGLSVIKDLKLTDDPEFVGVGRRARRQRRRVFLPRPRCNQRQA